MARNQQRRRSLLVSLTALAVLAGCSSDGLDPDVTIDRTDDQPPATDTRTVDPPTVSNLPITQP